LRPGSRYLLECAAGHELRHPERYFDGNANGHRSRGLALGTDARAARQPNRASNSADGSRHSRRQPARTWRDRTGDPVARGKKGPVAVNDQLAEGQWLEYGWNVMASEALLVQFTVEPPAALFAGAESTERMSRLRTFYRKFKLELERRLANEPVEIA